MAEHCPFRGPCTSAPNSYMFSYLIAIILYVFKIQVLCQVNMTCRCFFKNVSCQAVLAHTFNPSSQEAEGVESL